MEFINYNANPKKLKTGDCVIRAICTALDMTWEDTYRDLCEIGLRLKVMCNNKKVFNYYLHTSGYEMQKMPKKEDGKRYTVEEFADTLAEPDTTYVISVAHHLTVIKDKTLYDIWDCRHKCVGNFWIIKGGVRRGTKRIAKTRSRKEIGSVGTEV